MLHHAIWKSDGAAFDMLMKAGVPLDVCDMKGHSPLHEVIGWLMCNRDTGTQEPTILDHSARCIRVWEAFARRLIQAGASCDARDDNGKTPLDLCEGPFGPEIRTLIEEELSRR
jgi:ankyrin repeat protein